MVREKLTIENFAGIKHAEIELDRMNVFIGPQATGKSVAAKLLYFFRDTIRRATVDRAGNGERDSEALSLFSLCFPPSAWPASAFAVRYETDRAWLGISGDARKGLRFDASESYGGFRRLCAEINDRYTEEPATLSLLWERENLIGGLLLEHISARAANEQIFVPAGRMAFYTMASNLFTLIGHGVRLDPFMVAFGQAYEKARPDPAAPTSTRETPDIGRIAAKRDVLIRGEYRPKDGSDYVISEDGRSVNLQHASSGQQEVLPLLLILMRLATSTSVPNRRATMFVEEPEAHLFPDAQRELVHMMVDVSGVDQYVITTHSPYILTAINNLMYGARIIVGDPSKKGAVTKILEDAVLIPPSTVRAYTFGNGTATPMLDPETGLMSGDVLDEVSGDLAHEFEQLVDIEFVEQAA